MINSRFLYLPLMLALAACASADPGPPSYVIPPGPPVQANAISGDREDPDLLRSNLSTQQISHSMLPPAGASEYGRGPAATYTPQAMPHTEYVAPNPSPITGYGPGGMMPMPGAPANPPYSTLP